MILEVSKRVLGGEKVTALENATEAMPRLSLPHAQLNPVISIIPVSYGCLGSCAYCCVTLARGSLRSHRIEDIVERAKNDMALCARELWITAQDTASYGRDLGTNLAELLRALCHVEGEFWIRVGMMTPNMANDILEELGEIFLDDHVFKFIHLPVQSGNNKTLKLMRRSYSVDDFKRIVAAFRESLPEITVSTDVICGFPGESEDAFEDTLRLIEEVKPDIVNVSKFFARPNTLAAKMKESTIPLAEIRRRSSLAANAAKKVASERNQRWVSWSGEILVDEVGKVANSWVGRNFAYKPIAVKSTEKFHGRKLFVRVVKPHPTYLEAEIVE
jgi:MiaB/RimO family radical SAM methylthiotransferase